MARIDTDHHNRLPQGMKMWEFVMLMAVMTAIPAMSIDMMLPALPDIGRDLNVSNPNDRQSVVLFFFLGLAAGSLFYGPLSDRYGRRAILIATLCCLLAMTIIAALAPSFPILIGVRLAAGFFAAACRVTVVSIVRDCFRGDAMARIISLIMMVFIIVPMLAPSLGYSILLFAPWRFIFWILAALILLILIWASVRLPETLAIENRTSIGARDLAATFARIVSNRNSIGHMLASGLMMAGMVGFVVSVQQIFYDVFEAPDIFPLAFAVMAAGMVVGSMLNSRLVERFGARRMSQTAVILLVLLSALHCAVIISGYETLIIFSLIQGLGNLFFAFAGANFSAISLEPFTKGAGLASSVQAFLSTLISALLGGVIGAHFDGSPLPIAIGFLTFSSLSLLVIAWAEGWKLFRRPGLAAMRKEVPCIGEGPT